ncbi:MAG: tetratricopeptide repeat-containing glycosyltransferase family protein [Sterolibacterium sp.]
MTEAVTTAATHSDPDRLSAAHAHRAANQWQAAIDLYRQVAEQQAEEIGAWVGLALCHEALGNPAAAGQALRSCLAQRPQTAVAHHRLGWLCYQKRHFDEALSHYLHAIHCAPAWYEPHYHAAVSCQELRRYPEAVAHYQNALNSKADLPEVWYHAAKALKDGGQLDAALPAYQKALELQPDYAAARYSLGLLHLLRGDWLAGWQGYELRWQGSDRAATEHRPATALPPWQGENVPAGSGIVVYAEQGMGDSIMCFRYASLLAERFAKVKFAETAPLVPLFRHGAPAGVEVVTRIRQAIDETGYTHYIHSLSLPAAFRTTPENVPSPPYLQAPPDRTEFWRRRLACEARKKVGLVWQGGKLSHAPARDMSFEHLRPLLAGTDILWLSLQKDATPQVTAPVTDWMNEMGDFADTAALIANLDLVIAVDTAVAHLAGALGKPVWLLNRFESEWRWMRGRNRTPWYPSMRIFNQPEPGDWGSVIRQVTSVLAL